MRAFTTITRGHANAARALAVEYPRGERAEAQRMFAQLLTRFSDLEDSLGLRHGDVAGALAVFLGTSIGLHRDVDVTDAQLATLADSLRPRLAADSEFGALTASQRRYMFEALAILGMLMTCASRNLVGFHLDAPRAQFRNAAGAYLRAFLGEEPGRFAIGVDGIDIPDRRSARARRRTSDRP